MLTSSKCKQMSKNPVVMITSTKSRHPTLKNSFSILNYKTLPIYRGLEQLSSSSCWCVMAIYHMGVKHPRLVFVGVEIFTNFWFLINNFGSKYAKKSIKGSKDSHDGLDSKTVLSQKNDALGWRRGPAKLVKKLRQHAPIMTSLTENLKPKTKNRFFFQLN